MNPQGNPPEILFESQKLTPTSAVQQEGGVRPAARRLGLDSLAALRTTVVRDEFTVAPTDRGGPVARKGFGFQDIYTIFLMTKFLDEDIPATLVRIEGAEDVDLLTWHVASTCEWYYQIKTIKEGNNWTLRMFDTENVWCRFAHCISEFRAKCTNPNRSIQVVLVVDGDVSDDVQDLRDCPQSFSISGRASKVSLANSATLTQVRGEALFSIALERLRADYANLDNGSKQVRQALESHDKGATRKLKQLCQVVVPAIDSHFVTTSRELGREYVADIVTELVRLPAQPFCDTTKDSLQPEEIYAITADLIGLLTSITPSLNHLNILKPCLVEAYLLLDPLFSSLQIESRIGFAVRPAWPASEPEVQDQFTAHATQVTSVSPVWHSYLEQAIQLKLIQGSYLSPEQAVDVYGELKALVQDVAQIGGLIDQSVFLGIILAVPRLQLEEIPSTDDLIQRPDLVSEIVTKLGSQSIVYLYGFSKIGKTKLAAMAARKLSADHAVFWHTLATGTDCTDRLISDLAYFVGNLTGSRNLYEDWHRRKRSPAHMARVIAPTLTGHSVLIVLDNCHVLDDGQMRLVNDLLDVLVLSPQASVKAVMIGEARPNLLPGGGSDVLMRVDGLSFKESIALLKSNGCLVTNDNLLEFLSLHSKIGGHPSMLLIAASKLEGAPAAQAVSSLTASLPDLNQDTAQFFDRLSTQILGVLTTDEQKSMLRRLSVLSFGFDRDLCFELARCAPAIDLKQTDWLRLEARVLERSRGDRLVVPEIFRQIASEDVPHDLKSQLYETTAHHILHSATARRKIDFLDFQDAILCLAFAGKWEEAARYFLGSSTANPSASYKHLHLLYSIFRGPAFRACHAPPDLRFALAASEFNKIITGTDLSDVSSVSILEICRQMRSAAEAIEDKKARAIRLCIYYSATSSLYGQLALSQSAAVTAYGTLKRESPAVAARSKHSLQKARMAFGYALQSDEFDLVQSAFWLILHSNDLVVTPSVEEVPAFIAKILEHNVTLDELAHSTRWRPIDFWDAILDTYVRYAINHPNSSLVLSTLERHLEFTVGKTLTRLAVIVRHAIAQWCFGHSGDRERIIQMCTDNISVAEQIDDNDRLLKESYTLRADAAYALKDYEHARIDYALATRHFRRSTSFSSVDITVQYKVGDCCWQLKDYRSAAAAYLKALAMRRHASGYNHANSFRLFGRLSLAYLSMGLYWNAIQLHEKMFSVYERFRDDAMFVRAGGSLLGTLAEIPDSGFSQNEFRKMMDRGQHVRPSDMGPEFYDAPIRVEGVQTWLDKTSPAGFRLLLAQGYDAVGDVTRAIHQAERSLCAVHVSSYVPLPIQRALTHDLLSDLHRKKGDRIASARAAFGHIALAEGYLASQPFLRPFEDELMREEHFARFEALRMSLAHTAPWEYAQHLFRHHVEPVVLQEINRPRSFNEQAKYFLALIDMASVLPIAVRPCVEAWVQLYSGLFYLRRGHQLESRIAFARMNELIAQHGLLYVEMAYWLHTTFGGGAHLYSSASDLTAACVKTASKMIDRIPDSRPWLSDYNEQFIGMWCNKITFLPDDPLLEAKAHLDNRLRSLQTSADVEERFFHVCAVLLLWIQEARLWSDDARMLQQKVLTKRLYQLESDDLFRLYSELGSFIRQEAQRRILGGNVEKAQELSRTLYDA
jgi:tetratricopeptide (TPR) repeat protein